MQRSLQRILRVGKGGFLRTAVRSGTLPILMGRKEDPLRNYMSTRGSQSGPALATSHQHKNEKVTVELPLGDNSLHLPCAPCEVNYIWLRENCRCSQCYSADFFQTWVHPHKIPADIRPHSATISSDGLRVSWPDGHISDYNLEWLREHVYPYRSTENAPFLWERDTLALEDIPRVQYADFMNPDESGVKVWVHLSI